ncbi:hypothetical protein COV81_03990 [Candidatus Peregrinibacteria bacterium CG11_big_fil_rev_8_21_14_0_20_41_10]
MRIILLTVTVNKLMKQQAAQVYFPKNVYIKIKQIAKKENKPLAAWIRDVVQQQLAQENRQRKKLSDLPTFTWDVEDKNLSENIDKYIYDTP